MMKKAALIALGIVAGLLVCARLTSVFLKIFSSCQYSSSAQAHTEVKAVENAIRAYLYDYHYSPQSGSCRLQSTGAGQTDASLTDILRGINTNAYANPRGFVYLDVNDKSLGTNVVTAAGKPGAPGAFYDPWGNLYQVAVASPGSDIILNADGETLSNRTVAVWSWGPHKVTKPDPNDSTHIRSWR